MQLCHFNRSPELFTVFPICYDSPLNVAELIEHFVGNNVLTNRCNLCLSIAKDVIIPRIINNVMNRRSETYKEIPQIVKLVVESFYEEGLELILKEVVGFLNSEYRHSDIASSNSLMKLYIDTVAAIPSRFRESALIDIIKTNTQSLNKRDRVLASLIIPLVADFSTVLSCFNDLACDSYSYVRSTLIKGLPNISYEHPDINRFFIKGCSDPMIQVRSAAASVYGNVDTCDLHRFIKLFEDDSTAKYCLNSLAPMIRFHGFLPFFSCFERLMEDNLNDTVQFIADNPELIDEAIIVDLLYQYRFEPIVLKSLATIIFKLSDGEEFLCLLDADDELSWRKRRDMAMLCQKLFGFYGNRLLNITLKIANDKIAAVRNESVVLIANIILEKKTLTDMEPLYRHWHQRLILAKVVNIIGNPEYLSHMIERLRNDEVENVRNCLNNSLNKYCL